MRAISAKKDIPPFGARLDNSLRGVVAGPCARLAGQRRNDSAQVAAREVGYWANRIAEGWKKGDDAMCVPPFFTVALVTGSVNQATRYAQIRPLVIRPGLSGTP